jgi:hypothetical protein
MSRRFARNGLGYRFAPEETPLVFMFSAIDPGTREFRSDVRVFNDLGERLITRNINLKASVGKTGSARDFINELCRLYGAADWESLIREVCESVMVAHYEGRPVSVIQGEIERPPPPAWLCQGLLLKDKPNCWLGAASTGKSTLSKGICAYYAAGFRFCDREMERGVPLFLDWEDDEASFRRVVYDVCRNLGAWPLPLMLWRDMRGYKLRDQIERLGEIIDKYHVGLIVLDAIAAAGGSPNEHLGYEAVALALEECLGALPPVTVLALDHVTGEELKNGRSVVPVKGRGAVRKVEFFRNQWSLVADDEASKLGRHVVNWHHTKVNAIAKEEAFATEIIHRETEISIVVRPMRVPEPVEDDTKTGKLLLALGDHWRTPHDLAMEIEGGEPTRSQTESVRKLLERAWKQGRAAKSEEAKPRYSCRQGGDQGLLIPFPGSA